MKIIPLNCPNCGKRLEIGENKEQLACGTCGSQLYVDRSGGTISLELAKSLGAINTGAAQTAAELALVRLEKERITAHYEVIKLEREIVEKTSALTHYTFKEQDIMSEKTVASVNDRAVTLEAKIKSPWNEIFFVGLLPISLIIVCIFAAVAQGNLILLIPFGIVAIILWLGIIAMLAPKPKDVEDMKAQIARHHVAIANRELQEEATATISRSRELLPDARASLTHIEEEIAHNKKIVSLKH